MLTANERREIEKMRNEAYRLRQQGCHQDKCRLLKTMENVYWEDFCWIPRDRVCQEVAIMKLWWRAENDEERAHIYNSLKTYAADAGIHALIDRLAEEYDLGSEYARKRFSEALSRRKAGLSDIRAADLFSDREEASVALSKAVSNHDRQFAMVVAARATYYPSIQWGVVKAFRRIDPWVWKHIKSEKVQLLAVNGTLLWDECEPLFEDYPHYVANPLLNYLFYFSVSETVHAALRARVGREQKFESMSDKIKKSIHEEILLARERARGGCV